MRQQALNAPNPTQSITCTACKSSRKSVEPWARPSAILVSNSCRVDPSRRSLMVTLTWFSCSGDGIVPPLSESMRISRSPADGPPSGGPPSPMLNLSTGLRATPLPGAVVVALPYGSPLTKGDFLATEAVRLSHNGTRRRHGASVALFSVGARDHWTMLVRL